MADSDLLKNDPDNKEVEGRIKDLSHKVKTIAEEKEVESKARKEAEDRASLAEKERDFFSGFSDSIASYPEAKDHKDEIKAKVLVGYSIEDATVSVLAKAGKLNKVAPKVDKTASMGGSATVNVSGGSSKPVSEMTQAEKKQALLDAEKSGDLSMS